MSDRDYMPDMAGSKGFALFSRQRENADWLDGLRFLNESGFSLIDPNVVDATAVATVENMGERHDLDVEVFQEHVMAQKPINFRVWTHDGDDMLCEFRRCGTKLVEWYWFGQLVTADSGFVSALVRRFQSATAAGRTMIVVDWHALSENFDWPALLAGAVAYSGTPPEVFGIPLDLSRANRLVLQGFRTQVFNGHVLHKRSQDPDRPVGPPLELPVSALD
ncbi:hypothetical protein [Enhygromyxa salina]|uniref:Uncharacterized protein n=1 Tax=Enhygromyxa salina TaxID=215803 RepID=A0A2S9YC82_9BACT|nr:hypothetical protein [Enhygromyxa salina]PRQ02705.1 hypothetical protein ENSA7_55340 [Enhygromyxa salina]